MENLFQIGKFSYFLLKETEKAICVKVPYWKPTGETKKKHIQEYFETWIPKAVLVKGEDVVKSFVISKKEELRTKNFYQKNFINTPTYNTFGELAPIKNKCIKMIIDLDKVSLMREELMKRCNVSRFDSIFIDGAGARMVDVLTIEQETEIEKYASRIRDPKIDDELIPKKKITYYESTYSS